MDEHNLIWISANKSGNRVLVSRRVMKAILALNAIQQEYALDETRIYVAGFSGGGKIASMIATDYANTFDGGLFICGVEFWDAGVPHIQLVIVYDMGHDNPPRREISRALEFLDNAGSR